MHILSTPIEYLKGVGPVRADLLKKELHIFSYGDLLRHFPFRYIDKSKIYKISDLKGEMSYVQIKGKVIRFEEKGQKRSKGVKKGSRKRSKRAKKGELFAVYSLKLKIIVGKTLVTMFYLICFIFDLCFLYFFPML